MSNLNDLKGYVLGNYNRRDIIATKGKGSYLWDENDVKYLDFVSGIAVNALGHSSDIMIEALKEQSNKLIHISNLYWNEPMLRLAEILVKMAGDDFKSAFFCNSGTEAIEGCLKLMRKFGSNFSVPKRKILYFSSSFHGRTIGALSVTGEPKYRTPYIPVESEVIELPYNDVEALKNADLSMICGAIVETVQGEGGVSTADKEFLELLKKKSLDDNFLLAFDEIQCGIARTGKFFGFQNSGVNPDLFAMAKGLGGGMPIGGIIVNERADVFVPGDHGSTFGGNPLVCAVAYKVIETIVNENLMGNVMEMSDYIDKGIKELMNKYSDVLLEIRGKGLLKGIKINDDIPVGNLVNECFNEKILLVGAGGNVVRILPPLNVKKDEIHVFLKGFEAALSNLSK